MNTHAPHVTLSDASPPARGGPLTTPSHAPAVRLPRRLAFWRLAWVFIGIMAWAAAVQAQPVAAEPASTAHPALAGSTGFTTDGTAGPNRRPRVGLVLSGGGARGFAHVGVLKALEAARVPIDVVVGTSMGAIVGGLYAAGMTPQMLEQELMGIPWDTLFERRAPRQALSQQQKEADFELSPIFQIGFRDGEFRIPSGAVSTRSLEWLLRRYTLHTRHLTSFDALPTPFRAVATNMETGEAVVLDKGDLAAALRASMSVPGVFAPLELDGRLLGDGGLVNNLPVDVARSMGADVLIAVNIGTPLAGRDSLTGVVGVTMQMINILTEQNVQRSMATLTRNDLLLLPPLGKLTSADFSEAARIAELGNQYGQAVSEALARFAIDPTAYAHWQLTRQPADDPPPHALAFVQFEGITPEQAQGLQHLVDTRPGKPLDHRLLADDLVQLAATGNYDAIDYRLVHDPQTLQEGLAFHLSPRSWGPNYLKLGLDLRTDFQGDAGFNLRLNHSQRGLSRHGTVWQSLVEIGNVTGLRTELIHPLGGDKDRFLSIRARLRRDKVTVYDPSGTALGLYQRNTASALLSHGWTTGRGGNVGTARVGAYLSRRHTDTELVNQTRPNVTQPDLQWTEAGLRLGWVADVLDYAHFPQAGYRTAAEASFARRRIAGNTTHFSQLEWQGTRVFSWGAHTLNLFGRVARVGGMPEGSLPELALGGFQQLSGYKVGQVAGNHLALGRVEYYRRLSLDPGVARALFAGGSVEFGNAWQRSSDISLHGIKMGYSLYAAADTGLGPVYLAWVHAKGRSPGIYLFLGKP